MSVSRDEIGNVRRFVVEALKATVALLKTVQAR